MQKKLSGYEQSDRVANQQTNRHKVVCTQQKMDPSLLQSTNSMIVVVNITLLD